MDNQNGNGRIPLGDLSDRELLLLAVQRLNEVCADIRSVRGRVDSLEGWRDKAVGVLVVVSILVSAAVTLAVKSLP